MEVCWKDLCYAFGMVKNNPNDLFQFCLEDNNSFKETSKTGTKEKKTLKEIIFQLRKVSRRISHNWPNKRQCSKRQGVFIFHEHK